MKVNCVICSDLLDSENSNVTTSCGHVFHELCVLQWLEYKSTCPACRRATAQNKLVKIYLTVSDPEKGDEKCGDELVNEISTLKASLRSKDTLIKKLENRASEIQCYVVQAEIERDDVKKQLMDSIGEISSLKMRLRQIMKDNVTNKNVLTENKKLESQLILLKNVEAIINGYQSDINEILNSYSNDDLNSSHVATYFTMMKKQLQASSEEKSTLHQSNREFRKRIGLLNAEINEMKRKIDNQKLEIKHLTENLDRFEDKRKLVSTNANDSSETSMTLETTLRENTPTPLKRPKINMVNALVKKLKSVDDSDDDNILVHVGKSILNNKQLDNKDTNDSLIRQGYDGLGGHSKHVFRSAPIKLRLIQKKSFKK